MPKRSESSARGRQRVPKETTMKKVRTKSRARRIDKDTMREEYDFSKAVRGVTAARYLRTSDIRDAFGIRQQVAAARGRHRITR